MILQLIRRVEALLAHLKILAVKMIIAKAAKKEGGAMLESSVWIWVIENGEIGCDRIQHGRCRSIGLSIVIILPCY